MLDKPTYEELERRIIELEKSAFEQEREEKALRTKVHNLMFLMDASLDGLAIIDQTHRVRQANKSFAEMLGYTPEEVLRLHTWDWEDQLTEKEIRDNFADLSETQTIFETIHRRKDGTTHDAEVTACGAKLGEENMILTITRDITRRKHQERELLKNEQELRYILDSLPDMVLEVDKEMHVLWANKTALDLKPDAIGQTCYQAFPGKDTICEGCYCMKAFASGKIESGIMYQPESQTVGESYWENVGIPFRTENGRISTILEVSRNVTSRVKVETERENLIAELKEALLKVRTLSGLLPICSHCKKIRDDKGYWSQIESYIHKHSDTEFSHSICPECAKKYYPDMGLYDD